MIGKFLFGFGAFLLPFHSTPALARDPLVLSPVSPWNVRYDEDKCRLVRLYGSEDERIELNIDQSGVEPFFTLFLIGKPLRKARRETASVQFGPYEQEVERTYIRGRIGDDKLPFVIMHGIQLGMADEDVENGEFVEAGISQEREQRIAWLQIGDASITPLRFELPGFGPALAAMKQCSEDLVRSLGLDEEGQARVAEPATFLNGEEIARTIQYPARYARDGEEGVVRFRLTINSKGTPTNCQIARSSRPAVFDDIVCLGMIKHAEFTPAKDVAGNPVASVYDMTINFVLN